MANTPPVWIKAAPHVDAEFGVGTADPNGAADVLNRPRTGLFTIMRSLLNLYQDGATINQADQGIGGLPASVLAPVRFTNVTGSSLVRGDVVAVILASEAVVMAGVVQADTAGSFRTYVVALDTIANNTVGPCAVGGAVLMKAAGTIPLGAYVRKSATLKAVEATGVLSGGGAPPPDGTLGVALVAASSGFVYVWQYGRPITTEVTVPVLAKATVTLGASFATTSTALVTVPNLSITLTTGARRVLLGCSGALRATSSADAVATFRVAGVDVATDGLMRTDSSAPFTAYYRTGVLTAGSNTFAVRLRCTSGSAHMQGGTRFWVQELL